MVFTYLSTDCSSYQMRSDGDLTRELQEQSPENTGMLATQLPARMKNIRYLNGSRERVWPLMTMAECRDPVQF